MAERPKEDRAVHRVSLAALEHNYSFVESSARAQQCSVIVVVKADGYGHGAIATALYLADCCGASAFAVATLEEAIHLRRAFESNPPGRWSKKLAAHFHVSQENAHPAYWAAAEAVSNAEQRSVPATSETNHIRPPHIRIMVLGPPVGYPQCFNDYRYHEIELTVSGPEVASHLLAWVADGKARKRTEVETAATELKAKALIAPPQPRVAMPAAEEKKNAVANPQTGLAAMMAPENNRKQLKHPSSTLGNVSGQDLAKELRVLLMQQKAAAEASALEKNERMQMNRTEQSLGESIRPAVTPSKKPSVDDIFAGAEIKGQTASPPGVVPRKRLRWHALVDSGMGRAGFKAEETKETDPKTDTVSILKSLVDVEKGPGSPLEFYGIFSHMADAKSTSSFTAAQISKFTSLLKRVRSAGISIPTISTDNSAALLTTSLNHFDPATLLAQGNGENSRGFVRVGGAIYGQRPAFPQLKPVSTLCASVRHVAVIRKGESVGYDCAYVAPYDVRIATLTIGFADGYPRTLGNRAGKVQIRGKAFPIAGNVCMDMLMVELGPASATDGVEAAVTVGDTAVLWGSLGGVEEDPEQAVLLADWASALNTTQSSLTCGLDKLRVRRHFL